LERVVASRITRHTSLKVLNKFNRLWKKIENIGKLLMSSDNSTTSDQNVVASVSSSVTTTSILTLSNATKNP